MSCYGANIDISSFFNSKIGLYSCQESEVFGLNFFWRVSEGCFLLFKLKNVLQKPCCDLKKIMDLVHDFFFSTFKVFLTRYDMLPFKHNMIPFQHKNFRPLATLFTHSKNDHILWQFFVIWYNKSTHCDVFCECK